MAVSQWKLTRMEVAEAGIFQETATAKAQLPLLDRLWQAQGRLERAYARAHRELERLQYGPNRIHEPEEEEEPAPQPAAAAPADPKPQPAHKAPPITRHVSTEATPVAAPSVDESPRVRNTAMA